MFYCCLHLKIPGIDSILLSHYSSGSCPLSSTLLNAQTLVYLPSPKHHTSKATACNRLALNILRSWKVIIALKGKQFFMRYKCQGLQFQNLCQADFFIGVLWLAMDLSLKPNLQPCCREPFSSFPRSFINVRDTTPNLEADSGNSKHHITLSC